MSLSFAQYLKNFKRNKSPQRQDWLKFVWDAPVGKISQTMFNLPIEHHNESFYLEAVKKNHKIVNYVLPDKVDLNFLEKAVALNGHVLQYVPKERQTLKVLESAVKDVGFAIRYAKITPTYEISLLAVKRHPMALRNIKDQNNEIAMTAVSAEPRALEYVKKQTPEICLVSIKKKKECFKNKP